MNSSFNELTYLKEQEYEKLLTKRRILIEEMESQIPYIIQLKKRQEYLIENIEGALTLGVYSDGLLVWQQELEKIERELTQIRDSVKSLADRKTKFNEWNFSNRAPWRKLTSYSGSLGQII